MSIDIDRKFLLFLSPRLSRFTDKGGYIWNFRCPFCGDSKKNTLKSRGYVYRKKSNLAFMCHNCGVAYSFKGLLKRLDPVLYDEYRLERYKNESGGNVSMPDFSLAISKPTFEKTKIGFPFIEELEENHICKQYILDRKIPKKYWNDIYYAESFLEFSRVIVPDFDFENKKLPTDKRVVFMMRDENSNILGFQGRTLENHPVKYISVKTHDKAPKVFGLDKVDLSSTVYVLEGIIDSTYVSNSVALLDATLYRVRDILGEHDYVLIPDRDVRNTDVLKLINRMISKDYKVCLLPDDFPGKDLNEAIVSGMTSEELNRIIQDNIYQGLEARMRFVTWRKV